MWEGWFWMIHLFLTLQMISVSPYWQKEHFILTKQGGEIRNVLHFWKTFSIIKQFQRFIICICKSNRIKVILLFSSSQAIYLMTRWIYVIVYDFLMKNSFTKYLRGINEKSPSGFLKTILLKWTFTTLFCTSQQFMAIIFEGWPFESSQLWHLSKDFKVNTTVTARDVRVTVAFGEK